MTPTALEQDLRAFLDTLADRAEADAIRELFAVVATVEPPADDEKTYTPFVYPH